MSPQPEHTGSYCPSRFATIRRKTREVRVGEVRIGGNQPIVIQSMTTTPTLDVNATVRQSIALAEAGCEVVRITAQNVDAAKALGEIRSKFSAAGFSSVPLVADIHFLPKAAMEAALHVEKVRINPGNYADKKRFQIREYSDRQYQEELERLHEAFSPIVLRCRELGRAMRIGTNHGSLSDRIMNRFGDTPAGMVESALEFLRIARDHDYHDFILSMKASNPKVMIQAYRLMVARMNAEGMDYPLHLGVTEAGDGDDARIKSAIGIGSLLYDGLGDTIRVSLTEDPVEEIPVARALANKVQRLWRDSVKRTLPDPVDPYHFERRSIEEVVLGSKTRLSPIDPPSVIGTFNPDDFDSLLLPEIQRRLKDSRMEGLLVPLDRLPEYTEVRHEIIDTLHSQLHYTVWDAGELAKFDSSKAGAMPRTGRHDILLARWSAAQNDAGLEIVLQSARERGWVVALDIAPATLASQVQDHGYLLEQVGIFTMSGVPDEDAHALGHWRQMNEVLQSLGWRKPLWIRNTREMEAFPIHEGFSDRLLESSILSGALLADGIGDLISVESVNDPLLSTNLAYNILQGARARVVKTEYVACPSCGRTLFDLQETTRRIRAATGHLKGVTIAVMGCIVNGPGEMADADFGYVGGAPGRINLYVGRECVQFNIPTEDAVDALIALIRKHGRWQEPPPVS